MPTSREIGKIFKDAREEKGLSIEEAGHQSHILANVIRDIEMGVFDRLGKPYVKGFMRKYADFLGADANDVLLQYESISASLPSKEFDLAGEPKEEKLDVVLPVHAKQKTRNMIVAGLCAVLGILIIVLIGMMKDRPSSTGKYEKLAARVDSKVAADSVKKVPEKSGAKKTDPFKNTTFTLELKAQDEAWVQVKKADKTLYAGIMERGEKKNFTDDGTLIVLTGKGEDLLFSLNGRYIGIIDKGVVKNIKVSSRGIQLGADWITRLE